MGPVVHWSCDAFLGVSVDWQSVPERHEHDTHDATWRQKVRDESVTVARAGQPDREESPRSRPWRFHELARRRAIDRPPATDGARDDVVIVTVRGRIGSR